MAATGVGPGLTTPPTSQSSLEHSIIPVVEELIPLEMIAPGDPGNAIDVENPSNFEELNRVDPMPPMRRLSKRQAGVDPDCNPTKKYKKSCETSVPRFQLDPDFPSDEDSSDGDYELVARAKKVAATNVKEGSSESVEDIDSDLDVSLASFLLDLKKGEAKVTTTTTVTDQQEQGHDKEMEEEFAIGKQHATYGSTTESDHSHYSSYEFEAEEASTDTESSDSIEEEVEPVSTNIDIGVASSVANIMANTVDYELSQAVSNIFYTDDAHSLWPLWNRDFIMEKTH